ncbi:MAG: hypothetical protein ACK5AO_07440 [bacterium]
MPENKSRYPVRVIVKVKPDLTASDLSWAIEIAKLLKKTRISSSCSTLYALFLNPLYSQACLPSGRDEEMQGTRDGGRACLPKAGDRGEGRISREYAA